MDEILEDSKNQSIKEFGINCDCLPACKTISYDVEIDKSPYMDHEIKKDVMGKIKKM